MRKYVIPCGLEKYMAVIVNRGLVFIDSMQFMNESLDKLVNNLNDNDFKYLSKKFPNKLEIVKQKGIYPYEYMNSFNMNSFFKLMINSVYGKF